MTALVEVADLRPSSPTVVATRSIRAIGTLATVAVTEPTQADEALSLLGHDLALLDDACSRFRSDSELSRVEREGAGRPTAVSPLLFEALEVACVVAVQTAGIVDPTIGGALVGLGYDRDFDALEDRADATPGTGRGAPCGAEPAPGWWRIELDPDERTVRIPVGVHIDLGATAKAMAADRSARHIADVLGCGVLVNLGGDVAVSGAGPTWGGWAVGIAESCAAPLTAVDQVVTLTTGGLATSGTTARSWVRDGHTVHHIVDPWTGKPADPVWTTVSTVAPSCVEANAWSTAAVVWGHDAVGNLTGLGVPSRLVDTGGRVTVVAGWPDGRPDRSPRSPFDPPRLVA